MPERKLVTLDEGLQVYAANPAEAHFIHQEIFGVGCYDIAGLPERPFVVDAGANIGLSVLYVKRRYPAAEVLAFEPIPATAALLRQNLALHRLDSVTVHEVALGRAAEAAVPFVFYPMIPGSSTRHPETKVPAKARLAERMPARSIERMYRAQEVPVNIERLSTFLPAGRAVDLLKVDVEGAEVELLLGIDEPHWPDLRRVILEVSDLDGRVAAACELLRGHGLEVTARPPGPTGSPTYLLDARRPN